MKSKRYLAWQISIVLFMCLVILGACAISEVQGSNGSENITFYSETGQGVDGYVFMDKTLGSGVSWTDIRAGEGESAVDDSDSSSVGGYADQAGRDDLYLDLYRSIFVFDTSGSPAGKIVINAKMVIFGKSKINTLGNGELGIYGVETSSNVELIPGDYDNFGVSLYSDNTIDYGSFNVGLPGLPNEFVFNEAGKQAINRTGSTAIMLRDMIFDVGGEEPAWSALGYYYFIMWVTEKGGDYRPYLEVEFGVGEPSCPTGFEGIKVNLQAVNLYWDSADVTDYFTVRGSYQGVPSSNTSGFLIYTGTAESCNVTGLDLNSTEYSFSLFNQSGESVADCYEYVVLGGEDLEIGVTLPTGFYVLMAALFLVFISFFLKSPLIYLAVIPCMIGVILEPAFKDLWFQSGCVLVMIWAALSFWKKMSEGGAG